MSVTVKWSKEKDDPYVTGTATVAVGEKKVGAADLVRVKRGPGAHHFHQACDAHSSPLQEVGVTLFDGFGEPRARLARDFVGDSRGDFLYIDDLRLEGVEEDLAPRAIKALLLAVRGWALAAFYVSAPQSFFSDFPRGGRFGEETTAAEAAAQAAAQAHLDRLRGVYRQHVLRAGFSQVKDGSVYIATRAHAAAAPLARAAALAVPEKKPPQEKVPSAADAALFEFVKGIRTLDETADFSDAQLARVKQLIGAGASVLTASVLHVLVSQGAFAAFSRLLSLVPAGARAQAVNARDFNDCTPLHVAAYFAVGGTSSRSPKPDLAFCRQLLALGADKDAINNRGYSAYGGAVSAVRNFRDMHAAFGGAKPPPLLPPPPYTHPFSLRPPSRTAGECPTDMTELTALLRPRALSDADAELETLNEEEFGDFVDAE
jgi:hypothetical protein